MKLSDEIINSLSINLRKKINNIKNQSINIEEIRLRVNKPLIINGDSQDYFYNDINGLVTPPTTEVTNTRSKVLFTLGMRF